MSLAARRLGTPLPPRTDRDWVTSAELMAESGITWRQVDYWVRTGLLAPLDPPGGHGTVRRFPRHQVTRALVLHDLLDAGLTLQACRQVIDEVLATGRADLGPVTIVHHAMDGGGGMSTLTRFRDHCQRMATAEHKPECPSLAACEPYWPPGGWVPVDSDGRWDESGGPIQALGWLGPRPHWEPPACDGCVTDAEHALFRQMADEIDGYRGQQLDLFGATS